MIDLHCRTPPNGHFDGIAPEKISCAIRRHVDETARLYATPDKRLDGRGFIAGSRSIAGIACCPR